MKKENKKKTMVDLCFKIFLKLHLIDANPWCLYLKDLRLGIFLTLVFDFVNISVR